MSEQVNLTAPIAKPTQTIIKLDRVTLDASASSVYIQWLGENGEIGSAFYPTPPPVGSSQPSGATILHVLNTSNFTTTSFVKRVLQQLQTDGYVPAGTITGTPV
jgi:hypothetical protein